MKASVVVVVGVQLVLLHASTGVFLTFISTLNYELLMMSINERNLLYIYIYIDIYTCVYVTMNERVCLFFIDISIYLSVYLNVGL